MKKGIAASKGYAIGRVYLKKTPETKDSPENLGTEKELAKFNDAVRMTESQLHDLYVRTKEEIGEKESLVFEAHMMMLNDPEYTGAIKEKIEEGNSAFGAVKKVTGSFMKIFSGIEDEYMRERSADLKDVSERILANLTGEESEITITDKNTVVVARDLTPSDTAQLDRNKVTAFLTDTGGRTSHSAIMARSLEIPAIVGMGNITSLVSDGDYVIVDGSEGIVIINPTSEELKEYDRKREEFNSERLKLLSYKDKDTYTKSGRRVEVAANIGNPSDVEAAIKNGAEGIGLYRTEFLYMDRKEMPGEDEQFEAYKYVLEKMDPKPVVIRTLDIGGDKKLSYLTMPEEMNPFLGYRAIRLCLDRKDIFKVQLRALLRASVYGNLRVMFPMICSLSEYQDAMKIMEECRAELINEGTRISDTIQWGIMVEIPSAAIMADELGKHADFFSIGTNDLIQYTLAADRMSENVSYIYDPLHPAVLKLIKMTIDGAHKNGKWCGMCGEMAGDEKYQPVLLEMGLDEFSMSPSSILPAKLLISGYEG